MDYTEFDVAVVSADKYALHISVVKLLQHLLKPGQGVPTGLWQYSFVTARLHNKVVAIGLMLSAKVLYTLCVCAIPI